MGDRRGRLLLISAPSGAGKTSLVHGLLEREPNVRFSISCTTRPPRSGEVDGEDYHFLGSEEFLRRAGAGEFLEHAEVFGNLYGTLKSDVEALLEAGHDVLLEIDWQGAVQVMEAMPEAASVFVLPPSREELERRLRGRGSDEEAEIRRRLSEAAEEISHHGAFQHLVVNDDFEEALDALLTLVRTGEGPGRPAEAEAAARSLLA